jgi:TPR repeat protein
MTITPREAELLEVARRAFHEGRYEEATTILEPLVLSECIPAMTLMASAYGMGLGKPLDVKAAVRLYERAAELGDGLAAHNLGNLLLAGAPGVAVDKKRAIECFRQAHALGCDLMPVHLIEELSRKD